MEVEQEGFTKVKRKRELVIESTDNSPPRKIKGAEPVTETKKTFLKRTGTEKFTYPVQFGKWLSKNHYHQTPHGRNIPSPPQSSYEIWNDWGEVIRSVEREKREGH